MTLKLLLFFSSAMSRLISLSKSQVPLASLFKNQFRSHGCSSIQVPEMFSQRVELSSDRNKVFRFRTFCTDQDLTTKKCVACNAKDMRPMTEGSANELLQKVAGWELLNEDNKLKLSQTWKAKSFTKGLELFKRVGDVAEAEGHHPDLHLVGWNNVKIEIWTHAVGGLTENDFILAAKINKLELHDLLRKKPAA